MYRTKPPAATPASAAPVSTSTNHDNPAFAGDGYEKINPFTISDLRYYNYPPEEHIYSQPSAPVAGAVGGYINQMPELYELSPNYDGNSEL